MMKMDADGKVRAAGMLLMLQTDEPEFLLMRHPNRWDLPKGHCDGKETFLQTALRETHEETGIDLSSLVIDPDFLFETSYPVTYKKTGTRVFEKTVRYFLAYLQAKPTLTLTEHEAAHWLPWNPPHQIQEKTIDPLLAAVQRHLAKPSRRTGKASSRPPLR